MLRYARAIDERDWARVTALFLPDGVVEGTRFSDDVPAYLQKLFASLDPYSSTMHAMHNQYIDGQTDDTAQVVTYCVAYHVARDSGTMASALTVGVVYNDDLRLVDGEWRVAHRRTELKWAEGTFL
jgi:hypothetical protein